MRTNNNNRRNWVVLVAMIGLGILSCFGAVGCDEYAEAGDFLTPSVAPADFSPYGYDYDMYDLFTSDI